MVTATTTYILISGGDRQWPLLPHGGRPRGRLQARQSRLKKEKDQEGGQKIRQSRFRR